MHPLYRSKIESESNQNIHEIKEQNNDIQIGISPK
jgi:hypothetical protein